MRIAPYSRFAATAVAAAALIFALLPAAPAAAVTGFDSSYFSESAFPTILPGGSAQLAVGFNNTGATSWQRNSANQVNLAVCLADKVTCNVTSPNAAFASNWFSAIAYATQSTDVVSPGMTGYFVYSVQAPSNAAAATYRFNGDLVLGATGAMLHPQGYYQDVSVSATNVASMTISPTSATLNAGQSQQFTATAKDSSGATVNVQPTWTATGGTVTNTGLFTAGSTAGSFTVTATVGTASASATVTVIVPGQLTLSLQQVGDFTLLLRASTPLDSSTVNSTNFSWDSAAFPTTPTLNTGGNACSTQNLTICTEVRLDFNGSNLPVAGIHSLDIFNVKDVNGNVIRPNPTSLRVTISNDSTHPTVTGLNTVDSSTIDVSFSESMKTGTYYSSTNAADNTGNYRLVNRDGSQATTTGHSGSGSTLSISSVLIGGTSTLSDQIFAESRARLTVSPAMGNGITYFLLPTNIADEAGNLIDPNPTSLQFTNNQDTSRPTVTAVVPGSDQLSMTVTYSKAMAHNNTAGATQVSCGGGSTQIDGKSPYTSFLSDNVTQSSLGTAIQNADFCFISTDEMSVTFTFDANFPVQAGTYKLTVTGVQDKFGNILTPNPTDTNVTFTDTTPPTITSVVWGGSSSLTINYNESVQGGCCATNSAGNPSNYAVNNLGFGNLCTGTTTISASNSNKTWIIQCSGAGTWGAQGTNTLHVQNVADLAGNVIAPGTSKTF